MSTQVFAPHTLGTVFALVVRQNPLVDMSAIPVTVVLDNGSVRRTLRWLNGGSDGTLIDSNRRVQFSKSPVWSAANLTPGVWDVWLATGAHATTQQLILYGTLEVKRPANGPLPTAEGT